MPLTTHMRAGICWFFLFQLLPRLVRWGPKARLQPRPADLDMLMMSDTHCQRITRLKAKEVRQLAHDIGVDIRAPISGNWRFSPLHRLLLALMSFSNAVPSRKLRMAHGWAANAVLNNARYHIDAIIDNLGAPGSRQ